jgi:hypothetical protein
MGKLHRVRIIRRKTGNIPGERYAWIKFTIYDKEKQEMGLFVYRILRVEKIYMDYLTQFLKIT